MASASEISLADVPRQLRTHGVAVSYQKVYLLAVAGSIPARHEHNGRWTISRRDLKKIAAFINEQEAEKQRADEERQERREENRRAWREGQHGPPQRAVRAARGEAGLLGFVEHDPVIIERR